MPRTLPPSWYDPQVLTATLAASFRVHLRRGVDSAEMTWQLWFCQSNSGVRDSLHQVRKVPALAFRWAQWLIFGFVSFAATQEGQAATARRQRRDEHAGAPLRPCSMEPTLEHVGVQKWYSRVHEVQSARAEMMADGRLELVRCFATDCSTYPSESALSTRRTCARPESSGSSHDRRVLELTNRSTAPRGSATGPHLALSPLRWRRNRIGGIRGRAMR